MGGVSINLARYDFAAVCASDFFLPAHKGSTLRGGFGKVFRDISCSMRKPDCAGCLLSAKCPFSHVFEPSSPDGSAVMRGFGSVPRPFVIEPALERKRAYHKGDRLAFSLVLVGDAIAYLPYFILSFETLGKVGLGNKRGRYRIEDVRYSNGKRGELVYSGASRKIVSEGQRLCWDDFKKPLETPPKARRAALRLLTPMRLVREGQPVTEPTFPLFFENLLRRVVSLAAFHCGFDCADPEGGAAPARECPLSLNVCAASCRLDCEGMLERALQVDMRLADRRWEEWDRFSGRQKKQVKQGGLMGELLLEGELDEFLPYLQLGEYTHVGKFTTFGMGRYRITAVEV